MKKKKTVARRKQISALYLPKQNKKEAFSLYLLTLRKKFAFWITRTDIPILPLPHYIKLFLGKFWAVSFSNGANLEYVEKNSSKNFGHINRSRKVECHDMGFFCKIQDFFAQNPIFHNLILFWGEKLFFFQFFPGIFKYKISPENRWNGMFVKNLFGKRKRKKYFYQKKVLQASHFRTRYSSLMSVFFWETKKTALVLNQNKVKFPFCYNCFFVFFSNLVAQTKFEMNTKFFFLVGRNHSSVGKKQMLLFSSRWRQHFKMRLAFCLIFNWKVPFVYELVHPAPKHYIQVFEISVFAEISVRIQKFLPKLQILRINFWGM